MKTFPLVLPVCLVLAAMLHAEEAASKQEVEALKSEVTALKQALAEQREDFQARQSLLAGAVERLAAKIDWQHSSRFGTPISEDKPKDEGKGSDLEKEFEQALKGAETPKAPAPVVAVGSLKLIDIAFDILTDAGTSTANEDELARLEIGDHDPKVRGVRMPNEELTLAGVVDPYLRGDANVVFQIQPDGETSVELEEAYFTTTSLPAGLQIRGGQMFEQFGRINAMHPHTWDFVDHTVINSRLFGPDGLRAPTVELSWLTPLPFFAELTGAVIYGRGGTALSFLDTEGDSFAGHVTGKRQVASLEDLVYLIRAKTSFDLSDEWTLVNGASALFGPNDAGSEGNTQIYGVDFYLKWKPLNNDHGFPFVALQTEAMGRRYQTGDGVDADGTPLANEVLNDWGCYAQATWGFSRGWVLGARYDYANGDGDTAGDFLRDERNRGSVDLTYYPSEFSKIRLQTNVDAADHLDGEDESVWLQVEVLFGAHGAHKF